VSPSRNWTLSLWGKNVTDEVYASNSFFIAFVNLYNPVLGEGRTAGATLRYNFDAKR
jgi:outer membrane receptor protein involved in Fe transport